MELRQYLRIIGRSWLLVTLTFMLTVGATGVLVLPLPSVYQAVTTLLIEPRGGSQEVQVDASSILTRGVTIGATFGAIAKSRLIREAAVSAHPEIEDPWGVAVNADVVTDTSVLTITTRGEDPRSVYLMAGAIAEQTTTFVQGQGSAYIVRTLDAPVPPSRPVGPNKELMIGMGALFGLLLGIALALFASYLRGTPERVGSIQETTTGAFTRDYLRTRVREEIARADRTADRFAIATIAVIVPTGEDGGGSHSPPARDLRAVSELLRLTAPNEAAVGYVGGGAFSVLLPNTDRSEAETLLTAWETGISSLVGRRRNGSVRGPVFSTGSCEFVDGAFSGDRVAVRFARDLLDVDGRAAEISDVLDGEVEADVSDADGLNGRAEEIDIPIIDVSDQAHVGAREDATLEAVDERRGGSP